MKKKTQAASKMRTCPKCGKEVRARGYQGHLRIAHSIKLTTQVITTQVKNTDSSATQVTVVRELEQKVKTAGRGSKVIVDITSLEQLDKFYKWDCTEEWHEAFDKALQEEEYNQVMRDKEWLEKKKIREKESRERIIKAAITQRLQDR